MLCDSRMDDDNSSWQLSQHVTKVWWADTFERMLRKSRILAEILLNLDHIARPPGRPRASPVLQVENLIKLLARISDTLQATYIHAYIRARARCGLFVVASFLLGQPFFPQQRRPTCQHRKTLFCTLKRRKIGK